MYWGFEQGPTYKFSKKESDTLKNKCGRYGNKYGWKQMNTIRYYEPVGFLRCIVLLILATVGARHLSCCWCHHLPPWRRWSRQLVSPRLNRWPSEFSLMPSGWCTLPPFHVTRMWRGMTQGSFKYRDKIITPPALCILGISFPSLLVQTKQFTINPSLFICPLYISILYTGFQ